jgi:hypothetical protein
MREFVTSGMVVDLALALIALEAIFVAAYRRRTRRGVPVTDLLASLAAGACLLLALRFALTGKSWVWVSVALTSSLVGHGVDLWQRWRKSVRR